jgi:hypothetical protein
MCPGRLRDGYTHQSINFTVSGGGEAHPEQIEALSLSAAGTLFPLADLVTIHFITVLGIPL